MEMRITPDITALCEAFLQGLKAALGGNLYGVYLFGAVAFQDQCPLGDIDFHVIIKRGLNKEEKVALTHMHQALAQDYPPLGAELDGYYILLDEARRTSSPRHQLLENLRDESWALHRQHILAGRCFVLHGPDPRQVYSLASWPELEQALWGELQYVRENLDAYPAYCVLNLCRLMYSYSTRDVVLSKLASADWAEAAFPEWGDLIDAARQSYYRRATTQDETRLKANTGSFLVFAERQIIDSGNLAER